jgi:hypothetical protein
MLLLNKIKETVERFIECGDYSNGIDRIIGSGLVIKRKNVFLLYKKRDFLRIHDISGKRDKHSSPQGNSSFIS